jgi:hypothetical protein
MRAIAGVEFAYSGAIAGVITGGGLAVLIVGAVIDKQLESIWLFAPVGLIGASVAGALQWRRVLAQLRESGQT